MGLSKHLSHKSDVIRRSFGIFGIQANGGVVSRELLIATYMYAAQDRESEDVINSDVSMSALEMYDTPISDSSISCLDSGHALNLNL